MKCPRLIPRWMFYLMISTNLWLYLLSAFRWIATKDGTWIPIAAINLFAVWINRDGLTKRDEQEKRLAELYAMDARWRELLAKMAEYANIENPEVELFEYCGFASDDDVIHWANTGERR